MKIVNFALCLTCLLAAMSGCTKEKTEDCPAEPVTANIDIMVRAYQNNGTEVASDVVDSVRLFVYDGEVHFLYSLDAELGQPVSLEVPGGTDIVVVGWGNLYGDFQECVEPQPGQHMTEHCVDLIAGMLTRAESTPYLSPGDLFRADVRVLQEEQADQHTVALVREVGSMTVTIRGLKEHFGFDDDEYSIVVNGMSTSVDFSGNQTGGASAYHPVGTFGGNGVADEYYVPVFNLLPSSGMRIDIYHGTELIDSVTNDLSGKYIHVGQGIQTNVLLAYADDGNDGESALIDIRLSVTDWGEDELWKDF